jgi:tetratricopeptide (TPR) repeat protein
MMPTDAATTGLSPVFYVAHERNPNFTGRESLLNEMQQRLAAGQRTQVIHGLGGIGKSQVAAEFAHRHRADYSVIWWIRADTSASIAASYSNLATRLGRHLSQDAPPELVRDTIESLLARRTWLLIFDSTPDPQTIEPFLPTLTNGHILITSRNPNWAGLAYSQPLKTFDRADSIAFLHRRSGRDDSEASTDRLAHALGDLPLALDQAAACIEQTHISFADYLRRFETEWAELLQEGHQSKDYPHTVAMTWGLAFNSVEQASPAATELLNLCAFLNPDHITRELLRTGQEFLPPRLRMLAADPLQLNNAISQLLRYSLVDADDHNLALHRLVATITRDRLEDEQQIIWCNAVIQFLTGCFIFDSADVSSWARCGEIIWHVMETTTHAHRLNVAPDETAELLNNAGRYLLKKAQYADAKVLLERAMDISVRRYGNGHPKLSAIANNLGRVHRNLGDDTAALQCFDQALAIDQAAYGHSHPHVAEVVNNYGICLQKKGDSQLAREQFQWAAEVYESHYGPDHPKLAHILNNLGYVLVSLGDTEAASSYLLRALTLAESSVGSDHPTTARILYNLASVLRAAGQFPAAREYLERSLQIDETSLGPNHPTVANDCGALADLLVLMQQPEVAEKYFEQAKRIRSDPLSRVLVGEG